MEIMNIEDIKEAIEVLEDASAEMLMETGDKDYYSKAIAILRQAIEQEEHVHAGNKSQERVDETAKGEHEPVAWISDSPTRGNGRQLHWTKAEAWKWSSNITPLYTAPLKREWFDCTDEQLIAEVRRRGFVIRDAQIEQSEQEPVLWLKTWSDGSVSVLKTKSHAFADRELEPLYSAPPPRKPLTDEEIRAVYGDDLQYRDGDYMRFARAIEAAHGIGEKI